MKEKKYLFPDFPRFIYGGDYNPEQWKATPEIWDEDMRMMKLAHWNEASIGIFAWAEIEPKEGEFDFSVIDTIIEKAEKNGQKIILATPTGAKPHWLADKYPDSLRTREDGTKNLFGSRHNHCFSSPNYIERTRIIDRELSRRYGNHPNILCWHLSNEVNGECFCEHCKKNFIEFCRKEYDNDIEKLNHEWWTYFWSHRYDSFEQIDPPTSRGELLVHGLTLAWRRFVSASTADFMRMEAEAVREFSDKPVTTNLMGFHQSVCYRTLAEAVDFVSWDNYPDWGRSWGDAGTGAWIGMTHDLMRALKRKNFLLMESTPSHTNWKGINKLHRPGVNRMQGLQAIAHGSESVQYFQWRKSRGSSEKFHGAVVDHCGHENTRTFREVAALGAELETIPDIVGTEPVSDIGIIYDWDTSWALKELQGMQKDAKRYIESISGFYTPCYFSGINTDIPSRHDDLSSYKAVIAPMMYIAEEKTAESLAKYVEDGGVLVATYATAQVNENDLCHLGGFPAGKLKDVFGIWSEEIDTLNPEERGGFSFLNTDYELKDYAEVIHPYDDTEILGSYTKDFYQGMPAVTCHKYGKGYAYYIACRHASPAFAKAFISMLAEKHGISYELGKTDIPAGVAVRSREGGGEKYIFLINFNRVETKVTLDRPRAVYPIEETVSEIIMPPYGVTVLKETEEK